MKPRILIVEDDLCLANSIGQQLLRQFNCQLDLANTFQEAEELINHQYDVIILDRILGKKDALDLLATLTQDSFQTKVLILSGLGETSERENGLQRGASDYLTKPFSRLELIARVKNLLNMRKIHPFHKIYLNDDCYFFPGEMKLTVAGKTKRLSPADTTLLTYFVERHNQIVSRQEIGQLICFQGEYWTDAALNNKIYRLRRKLASAGEQLQAFYNAGYLLKMTNRAIQQSKIA